MIFRVGTRLKQVFTLLQFLFAAFLFTALALVVLTVPAFNADLRKASDDAAWDVPDRLAHYDQARYLYHLAYAQMQVDEDIPEEVENLPEAQALAETIKRARMLLTESLAINPSNAHVWSQLALAQTLDGAHDMALESLKTSWALAPNNAQMAETRLYVVASILDQMPEAVEHFQAEDPEIQRDMQALSSFSPVTLEFFLETSPLLAEFQALNE